MRQKRFVIGCVLTVLLVATGLPSVLVYREYQQQWRNKALIAAIYRNDDEAVASLLHEGADANSDDDKTPILTFQQVLGQWVDRLKGKPLPSPTAHSALWLTVFDRHNGGNPFFRDPGPDDLPILRALLEHGANPNFNAYDSSDPFLQHYQPTLLTWEAGEANSEAVRLLAEHGADPNGKDPEDRTAIMHAIVDSYHHPQLATLRILIEHGADVNAKDTDGKTALAIAQDMGYQETVEFLKQAGAKEEP